MPSVIVTCGIIALVWVLARIVYLVAFSQWDLLGDEAYYWAQGRHPALSYAEKGPLLAWILAAMNGLFGQHVWAVRLPVVLASGIGLFGVGLLVTLIAPLSRRAILLAAALFILTPALVANGQICTQDGLLVAWFVALAWFGWWMVRAWECRTAAWGATIGFYATLGTGVLLKQSVLLSFSALLIYAWVRRRQIAWRREFWWQQSVGIVIVLGACAPLIIWDAGHGWPLVRHTLQHLGAAEGEFASRAKGNAYLWFCNTLVGLVGAGGPAFAIMILASIEAYRRRNSSGRWPAELWLLCCSWPPILFYFLLSLTKPVVPSWPLPSLVTLVPLAAVFVVDRWPLPSVSPIGRLWSATVAYGIGGLLLLSFPTLLGKLPLIGPPLQSKVLSRFTGQQAKSDVVAAAAERAGVSTIVASHYQPASLLAFYLPPRWTVTCAGSLVGARRLSNYDEWPDTSLYADRQIGRDMLLLGGSAAEWSGVMKFDTIDPAGDGQFVGRHYGGPKLRMPQ